MQTMLASKPLSPVASSSYFAEPAMEEILRLVAQSFGVSVEDVIAIDRSHRVWRPRMAAMYLARLLTSLSLVDVGHEFGGRSHTTVLRACRRCRDAMDSDAAWSHRMDQLLVRLIETVGSRTP